jgi:hypothetical protein
MKAVSIVVWAGVVLSTITTSSASLFSENFGSLSHGSIITTTNTALTYARVGTGAGAFLTALNPGSFSGASALVLATSSSLTGLGVTNGSFPAFNVGTFSFSLHTPASFSTGNDLFALVGTGTTFSGNSAFNGNDLAAGLSIVGGQMQTRNALNAWEAVGSALAPDTSYALSLVFNGSSASVVYGAHSVAAGRADLWLNGSLWGDDISIRNAVNVSAFRIYCQGSAGGTPYEIDNLDLDNTAPSVPEPGSLSLVTVALVVGSGFAARKR